MAEVKKVRWTCQLTQNQAWSARSDGSLFPSRGMVLVKCYYRYGVGQRRMRPGRTSR
jgi:hypothetical protein